MPFGGVDYLVLAYLALGLASTLWAAMLYGDESLFETALRYKWWVAPFVVYYLCRGLFRSRTDVRALIAVLTIGVTFIAAATWNAGVRGRR